MTQTARRPDGPLRGAVPDGGRADGVEGGHHLAAGDVTPALFVSARIDDDAESGRRAPDSYARVTYGIPLAELEQIRAVVSGGPDRVLAHPGRYAAAGARHVVVRLGAVGPRSQRDRLERIAELIPALKGAAASPA
ncbi:hypothetical protein [Streptomyces similanensis]|uniref:LLM class flavin-dependent oxidoreductase n=1 Tax=Streptomyces similanensis TaxID=1274988 RepID=A0ABP9KAB5_9ACTN